MKAPQGIGTNLGQEICPFMMNPTVSVHSTWMIMFALMVAIEEENSQTCCEHAGIVGYHLNRIWKAYTMKLLLPYILSEASKQQRETASF